MRNTLSLRPAVLVQSLQRSRGRPWRGPIPFLAPVVDERLLHESVPELEDGEMPSLLQPDDGKQSLSRALEKLHGMAVPDYPDGRIALYPCYCGDLWCAAVGVRVTLEHDTVIWEDWAWTAMEQDVEPCPQLPVLRFARDQYEQTLAQAPALLDGVPDWEPPPQDPPSARRVWPWQAGWSLRDTPRLPGGVSAQPGWMPLRAVVRHCFRVVDPAGLGERGTWFPAATYDPEADRAAVWLNRGATVDQVVERTMQIMAQDWGITVPRLAQAQLAQALHAVDPRPAP